MKRCKGGYFDYAATSYPKPKAVLHAVERALIDEGGNPGRSAHALSLRAAERVFSAREAIADFFSLPDERGVVFTKNATEALNLAVHTFTRGGGHVLCDDMAHNALLRPLYALEDEGRISLSFFSGSESANAIASLLREDTVLICATHASNITSHVTDAEGIGVIAKRHGIPFVLDASQSAGHIDVNCQRIGANAVCLPAHKGLYGIMGAGAVLFSDVRDDYPVFLTGGGGSRSLSRGMPRELPEHFEAGTLPLPAIAAFEAGVRWVKKIGIDAIAHRVGVLEKRLREGLGSLNGVTLYGEGTGVGILSFTHKALSPIALAARLGDAGFSVRAGLHCAPIAHKTLRTPEGGTVRISLGYPNTPSECERLLKAVREITGSA